MLQASSIDHKARARQQFELYLLQEKYYKAIAATLEEERLFLELDLELLDTKIKYCVEVLAKLGTTIASYSQLLNLAVEPSNGTSSNIEFVQTISSDVVSGEESTSKITCNNTKVLNTKTEECISTRVGDKDYAEASVVLMSQQETCSQCNVESDDSDTQEPISLAEDNRPSTVTKSVQDTSELLGSIDFWQREKTSVAIPTHMPENLVVDKPSNAKSSKQTKYRLKHKYLGMSIADAAEAFMSQNPNQAYHATVLLKELYEGASEDKSSKEYCSLCTQLLLAAKNGKRRIKKHSGLAATYYYS